MTQALPKLADQSGNGGVVTEGHSAVERDPSANGACAIIFRLVTDYRETFGDRFDSLPFLTSGGYFIQGANLRSAKSGCEIWSRLQWDICRCRRPCQDSYDQQFTLLDYARRPLSNVRYRIVTDSGQIFLGITNASGQTQRVATSGSSKLKLQTEN